MDPELHGAFGMFRAVLRAVGAVGRRGRGQTDGVTGGPARTADSVVGPTDAVGGIACSRTTTGQVLPGEAGGESRTDMELPGVATSLYRLGRMAFRRRGRVALTQPPERGAAVPEPSPDEPFEVRVQLLASPVSGLPAARTGAARTVMTSNVSDQGHRSFSRRGMMTSNLERLVERCPMAFPGPTFRMTTGSPRSWPSSPALRCRRRLPTRALPSPWSRPAPWPPGPWAICPPLCCWRLS